MKALSWKQPYGSLMLHGKIETRTWPTTYRGEVLICTSAKPYGTPSVFNISGFDQQRRIYSRLPLDEPLPHGMAIAVATLVDCREMTKADEAACFVEYCEPWIDEKGKEKRLWCHIYENVRPIQPFPWKGSQGFSHVPQHFINNLIYL